MSANVKTVQPRPRKRLKRTYLKFKDQDDCQRNVQEPSSSETFALEQEEAKSETLCANCSTLNFDTLFRQRVKATTGNFIMNPVGPLSDLEVSACALCRIFASVALRVRSQEGNQARLQLRVFSATRILVGTNPSRFPGTDTTVLGLVEKDVEEADLDRRVAGAKTFESLPRTGCLLTTEVREGSTRMRGLDCRTKLVDILCIDQLDEEEKHAQISQMDLIYAKAQLTIIAATTDPDSGLPGVAGSLRKQQPNIKIDNTTIASTMSHSQIIMAKSRWVTRGWTYQEGLLSTRRLIFTDEQVLFECHGMYGTESLIMPLDLMHRKKDKKFRNYVPEGPLGVKTPGTNAWDIMRCISEFYDEI